MAINLLGSPTYRRIDRGWRMTGFAQFSTTDASGYIPIDRTRIQSISFLDQPNVIGPANGGFVPVEFGAGTISASANFEMTAPVAGVVSSANFVVHTTVATDAANIWTIGIINKATGAGTNVVVDIANAANSNNSTGGTAFTAFTPRALTLSATASNLVVAQGDVLEWTFTKASSAANLVALELVANITPSGGGEGGEQVYFDVAANVNTANPSAGLISPVPYISTLTPPSPALLVTRKGTILTSGLIFSYGVEGF